MKKNNLILVLVFVVALMAVAFATLSTSLTITGTGTISSTWGPIYITGCYCSLNSAMDASNPPTATCSPSSGGTSSTVTATITANMKLPGDSMICQFTVKNDGGLYAAKPTVSINSNSYFTVTSPDIYNTGINPNSSGVIRVVIDYVKETSSSQTITVNADYGQSATTAGAIPTTTTRGNTK